MPRPRLSWAAFLLAWLGVSTASRAAEMFPWLLAQSASVPRGPSPYLNIFKFVPALLIYLAWVATTHWAHDDADRLHNERAEVWNSTLFFAGVLGFAMLWIIPIYFLGIGILALAYLVPLFAYISHRNQMVEEKDKVLTGYHFGEMANWVLRRMGVRKPPFNRPDDGYGLGPPIHFVPGKQDDQGPDPELLEEAEQLPEYIAAKEHVFDAILHRATDIQFIPGAEEMGIRYRIDGLVSAAEPFDRETGDEVQRIFKLLAALDVAERRKPQEGTFSAKLEDREIDFRLATSGSKGGERMAMKVFDKTLTVTRLDETGLRPRMVQQIRDLIEQPSGLFLISGPAGSGRTTTLYACLREIDRFLRNILTLEEPIESEIDNVTQTEIDTKTGESFGETLRSLLRQDPDIIVVSQLDEETAPQLCQAANVGRFAMSVVTANDAVSALVRLLELGVDPQVLSTSVTAVLNQRLVRLLCETCKEPYKPRPEFLAKANLPADKVDVFYREPEAPEEICPSCGGNGYIGRTGIFELLVVTDPIRALLRENPSPSAIKAEARKGGMIYLQEDGLRQVIQGRTSIKELMRAVK